LPRSCHRNQKGTALIELALVLLPLCVVVFGALDLARAFLILEQLRNAAQAGALVALRAPTQVSPDVTGQGTTCLEASAGGTGSIQYQAANEFTSSHPSGQASLPSGYLLTVNDVESSGSLTGCGPDSTPAVVESSPCPVPRTTSTVCSGDHILVLVSAPFKLVAPLLGGIVGNITLHGSSEVVLP
jgi:hypothetical protein